MGWVGIDKSGHPILAYLARNQDTVVRAGKSVDSDSALLLVAKRT